VKKNISDKQKRKKFNFNDILLSAFAVKKDFSEWAQLLIRTGIDPEATF